MKRSIVVTIACVCALAAFADARPTVTVTASLKDGSSIRGDFLTQSVGGSTLVEKELVYPTSDGYVVYDRLMAEYLRSIAK